MNIIIDTREKTPLDIQLNELITGVKRYKLDAGDYSIESMEDIVAIERKASISEFAQNVNEDRFWDAISRLEQVRHPMFLVCFNISDIHYYPKSSGLSQNIIDKLRVSPAYLVSCMNKIIMKRIPVVFAGNAVTAERFANDFLCKIIKSYQKC